MFYIGEDSSAVNRANDISLGNIPSNHYPTLLKWKKNLLSEHSSLEFSDFTMYEDKVDGRIISHLVRHTKGHPRHIVESQREDWKGKERPPSETPRKYISKWTPFAWIQMARQRLCFKAATYTRLFVLKKKREMNGDKKQYFQGIGWASVSECIYRNGCPYSKSCGWYESNKSNFYGLDIQGRYDEYNRMVTNET